LIATLLSLDLIENKSITEVKFTAKEPNDTGMAIFNSLTSNVFVDIDFGDDASSALLMPSPFILWRKTKTIVPTTVLAVTPKVAATAVYGATASCTCFIISS